MDDRSEHRGTALRLARAQHDERDTVRPEGDREGFDHETATGMRRAPKVLGGPLTELPDLRPPPLPRLPALPSLGLHAEDESLLEAIPEVRHMLDLPESAFLARLDERVRRTNVLLDMIRAGVFDRDAGARALRSQLDGVRRGAQELGSMPELVGLLGSLADAVMALSESGALPRPVEARDVLVMEEDDVARDVIALTVESRGHAVRCARDFDEFVSYFDEQRPDIVLSEVELEKAPARFYCTTLRDLVGDLPIVFYARRTDDVREATEAARGEVLVSKAGGASALLVALEPIFARRIRTRRR